MSTCIHNNDPKWVPNPDYKLQQKAKEKYPYQEMNTDSPGQMVLTDKEFLPKEPAIGTMYHNIALNQVLIWTGNEWKAIDSPTPDEEVIKEWEIVTHDDGWCSIRIFENVEGERKITVADDGGLVLGQGLENVLEYIKNNTDNNIYLHSESRIFEYFS